MDGWAFLDELWKQCKKQGQDFGIPVIVLSGMERPDVIRRSRAAGCLYYVRKPYDPNALLILINHAIGETESGGLQ